MSLIDELDGVALGRVLHDEGRGVVVDFWSPWCAPCRALRPHLHKMAEDRADVWRFVAVNTEAHPTVAEDYDVRSLPTLVLFRDGEEISRLAGGITLSAVAATLDDLDLPRGT